MTTEPGAAATRTLALADPGPLGLAAFALTTFVLSVFNAGLVDAEAKPVVFGLALFYGGLVQVFAGLAEFLKKNTFGAVAFCSYGAFWMSFWYLSVNPQFFPAGSEHKLTGVGIFLLGWTIFTAYMWAVTWRINGILLATFSVLLVTFIFLTAGDLTGMHHAHDRGRLPRPGDRVPGLVRLAGRCDEQHHRQGHAAHLAAQLISSPALSAAGEKLVEW